MEDEKLQRISFKECELKADEAQSRGTETAAEQVGDTGMEGSRARAVKRRKNITKKAFRPGPEK